MKPAKNEKIAYFELMNKELARNKNLMNMSGYEAYEKYRLRPNRVFGYQAKFGLGVRMKIYVVVEEGDERNWSKAVLLDKHGKTIDETEQMYSFDKWSLKNPENGITYTAIASGETRKMEKIYIPEPKEEEPVKAISDVIHVDFTIPIVYDKTKDKPEPKDIAKEIVKDLTERGFTQKDINKILKELDRIRKNSIDISR